jgi:hypothetical protein
MVGALTAGLVGCGVDVDERTRADTVAFFNGPGQRLLAMHDAAVEQSRGANDAGACRVRAERLQNALSGSDALALVTQIPDKALGDAMATERVSLAESLAACANTGPPAPGSDLSSAATEVQGQLDDLGVRR